MKNIYLYISLTFVFAVTMISALNAQALGAQPMANHTLGLSADGTVYAWGDNIDGQLGGWYLGGGSRSTYPCKSIKGCL